MRIGQSLFIGEGGGGEKKSTTIQLIHTILDFYLMIIILITVNYAPV